MEATSFQIVGCVFSPEPAAERIDEFARQARRERAVVTARSARQATVVKFGATDAQLIALACRAAGAAQGSPLRFGFACSLGDRSAPGKEGARVSSRSLTQANDLAAGARDGQVLLSTQLASLLAGAQVAYRSKEVHLPGGRTAVACWLDDLAAQTDDAVPEPEAAMAAGPHESVVQQVALAAEQLERMTARVAALSQALEQSGRDVGALEERLARTKADRRFVTQHDAELADLRTKVERLLAAVVDTDGKIAAIESRRQVVDEVQSRADGIKHLLDDIHVNLEMLSGQRAVIDDVGEKLARLDFTVQEAHNTLRALQRERELAERIEQGIKALRARRATGKVGA
ncbi:MAG TPA: hypothetical protein VLE45_14845 [Burkholderiaceae bacterium]|nr:hypothetical protein [Burkholderiaceae bacterium]